MSEAPADGEVFDVVIIEATAADDASCAIEAVVAAGPRKGDVFELVADGLAGPELDPTELLGLPATVTIVAGRPELAL